MENKTTDEKIFSMRWNKFIPLFVAVIVATNTVSLTVQKVNNNENQIVYDREANKRRIDHLKKELQLEYQISQLKKELDNCK